MVAAVNLIHVGTAAEMAVEAHAAVLAIGHSSHEVLVAEVGPVALIEDLDILERRN